MPRAGIAATRRRSLVAWALLPPLLVGCAVSKRVGHSAQPLGSEATGPITPAGPVPLRVALGEGLPAARVTCTGPYRLADGRDGRTIVEVAAGDSTLVRRRSGGVAYATGPRQGRVDALVLAPRNPDDRMIWSGNRWRGELRAIGTPRDTSAITMIDVVELEDYLAGVVPLEIGRDRPERERAAVAAQAIAARTYAVSRLGARRDRGFDVYADTRDQVYGGAEVEDAAATAAIAATAGLILRHDGGPTAAFFHANCGGHTAAKEGVWPVAADPVLRGVRDVRPDGRPWCADGRGAQWRQQWSWAQLETVLQRSLPAYLDPVKVGTRSGWARDAFRATVAGADGRRPGALRSLRVAETSPDGRVGVLEVTTASGVYRVRGGRIRWVLRSGSGGALLRSTLFDLDVDPGRGVVARGRGHGHGLGLCQDGAVARARAGQSARDILAHYYPGARLGPVGTVDLP